MSEKREVPWPYAPAAATGLGPMPGTDVREAVRIVTGELTDGVHLPLLPARGPGADAIGRTMALLADVDSSFRVEAVPSGWRLSSGFGRDARRGASWLGEDLDTLEESTVDYAGPVLLPVTGPWTLAAAVELPAGERLLRDPGAVRDLTSVLAEGVRRHVEDVRRRVPGSSPVVLLDEPALEGVLTGNVPTASGWARYRSVERPVAARAIGDVAEAIRGAGATTAVRGTPGQPPWILAAESKVDALSVDLRGMGRGDEEELGTLVDSGIRALLGVLPPSGVDGEVRDPAAAVGARVTGLCQRLGVSTEWLAQRVVLTPAGGLQDASPSWVRMTLRALEEAGRLVRDEVPADQ